MKHINKLVEKAEANNELGYCETYDSYYNTRTNVWLEKTCGDINCHYCNNRPKKYIKPKSKS